MAEQPVDSSPHGGSLDREPQEIPMIGDFDSSASTLWTLYRDEAKSRDEAHIQTLKDGMDGVLIFVRSYSFAYSVLNNAGAHHLGWFIFCLCHLIYNRQQRKLESESCRSNGVLPAAKRRNAQPDLSANLLHLPAIYHPFVSATPLSCFQPIII